MGTLAAVFAASGVPKLRTPFPSALAMVRFGVTGRIRPVAGRLLGGVETLLAVALAALPDPFWPALAGVVLLGVFTGLIVAALARGRSFECACFGGGERISWATVVRNLVLIAATAAVVAAGRAAGTDERMLGVLAGALLVCGYALVATMAALHTATAALDGAAADA